MDIVGFGAAGCAARMFDAATGIPDAGGDTGGDAAGMV